MPGLPQPECRRCVGAERPRAVLGPVDGYEPWALSLLLIGILEVFDAFVEVLKGRLQFFEALL